MSKKKRTQNRFTPEIRDRAIRLVMAQQSKHSSQSAAIESIAEKIGCSPPTLHSRIKKREIAKVDPESLSSAERKQMEQLQRENKELKTANEILLIRDQHFSPRQSSTADPSDGGLHKSTP